MKIEVERKDDNYHMIARNQQKKSVGSDLSMDEGGGGKAMTPLEMLLSSLGACSSVDVISILRKQRQDLRDIKIQLEGKRDYESTPSLFTEINVHFILKGNVKKKKVERAIELSIEKYCTVAHHLRKSGVEITSSYEVIEV